MARNVEIKARVAELAPIEERVRPLADEGPIRLTQRDTFFSAAHGRLKLREFHDDRPAELIHYERPDGTGPELSRYVRIEVPDGAVLGALLGAALGAEGVVEKERTLYLIGDTRVHLDRVAGLGTFVELEVVLRPGDAPGDGQREAHRLMAALGIEAASLVDRAYVDLLAPSRHG